MSFYQGLNGPAILMWFAVLGGLMLLNELARASKWTGLGMYVVLPAILSFALWPRTAGPGTSMNDWFHWMKVYSALAGCVGFWAIRYFPRVEKSPFARYFPPLILAVNILEAVVRDFQCRGLDGIAGGIPTLGGPWNLMNGIAGIVNIITLTGWMGIRAGKGRSRDMLWPDQLWFWIVAYDLWNFAYTYNCLSSHSFYCGLALLLSCTIPAFLIKKGAWLQHRASTLGIWCMFAMTYPAFVDSSRFAVKSSNDPAALFLVSLASLVFNLGVLGYEILVIARTGRNPLKQELYTHLRSYKAALPAEGPGAARG
ncbi:MAG TPA: DUF5692 family protein [Spirochaetales bacterium]|nr:DUF5692 family protein [Spirochaetales bacterium]HRY53195.1 DUF5692 family protein [Spirochaetia bacterium]HRZ64158.1 DUF5692 family protein [Spirochaetia bacterium]